MKTARHDLDIVIVSYESRDALVRCLAAWKSTPHRVLVVDNASQDGSAEAASSGGVEVLETGENIGFGRAANAGIAATSAPFVLVSNADAWSREPFAVDVLLERLSRDDAAGAAGPQFVRDDGVPHPTLMPQASRWWTGGAAQTSVPEGAAPRWRPKLPGRPSFLVGAAILFRRSALDEVGTFDPSFFLFNEEVDLCRRLVAGGWTLVTADAVFVHLGGIATRPRWHAAYREQLRSHLRLIEKHEGAPAAEQTRRYLASVLSAKALIARGDERRLLRDNAAWLRSGPARELVASREALQLES